jgi:SAM-dependent methyltransferase
MSSEDLSSDKDSTFDNFAKDYDSALAQGLRFTGESKEYFAQKRIRILAGQLNKLNASTKNILDFGCGTGSSVPFLRENFSDSIITGIDPSEKSLEIAHSIHKHEVDASFTRTDRFTASQRFDLACCNGVFHHIPPPEQGHAAKLIFDSLKPGGYFSLWENNPWNPMTRFIMKRVPFDSDAILLWPINTRHLLRQAGFHIISTNFAFIFPSLLRRLRFLETPLCKLPLGGQYHVLCRKPLDVSSSN